MEPRLGLRLVRGPSWCWGDQDGGEGCVGTVVEVREGGRSAMVQWDLGTRALYRCGKDDKFDLRVFDADPTGLHFPDIVCSGCYMEGVAGIHWQCAHCYKYHLCHSCYMLGRHCQEHPFFRVESNEQSARVKMSCRAGAKRVEAKGVFVGAEVVRGPHWRFGDQDGGAGKTGRVVSIEGSKDTSRSIAMVEWSASRSTNIYRVGLKGKVDLCCTSSTSGGYYYLEHLAILGLSAAVTVFNEKEIVAGDFVKVDLDPKVFKVMNEAGGLSGDSLTMVVNESSLVLSILEEQRLVVCNATGGEKHVMEVCSDSVTKLKHCRVGQTVRVISNVSQLQQRQRQRYGLWHEKIVTTAGQIGRVTETYSNCLVQVFVQGRGWTFNPLCLEPAPGETAPYTPDPKNESLSSDNTTQDDMRQQVMAVGLIDEALLSGYLTTVERFVYNNETSEQMKINLLNFYGRMEMQEALRLCLRSGIGQVEINKMLHNCIVSNFAKAVIILLEEGADVNSVPGGLSPLMTAAVYGGNPNISKALATSRGVLMDTQDSHGNTALQQSGASFHHINTAVVLAAGANPTICSHHTTRCPIHEGAIRGSLAIMEVLVVHAREHLNVTTLDGNTPLHFAAYDGRTEVCSLLVAQTSVNINIQSLITRFTPLHVAADRSKWNVVECLVGWGAALNLVDRDGNTPLHCVIKKKCLMNPESPQIERVRQELSVASGGRAVEGYIAVACFLVREGADWLIKNKDGDCPHQALPPTMAALISEYLKELPGPESFHGSLRRELQERKLQELPLHLKLPPPVHSSMATTAAFHNATDNLSRKFKADSLRLRDTTSGMLCPEPVTFNKASYWPGSSKPEKELQLVPNTKFNKNPKGMAAKQLASTRPLVVDSQSSPVFPPSSEPTVSSPSSELHTVQPSGVSRQPCLLCEVYPASIRFSPCGHTVLCSRCGERAKRCLQCKVLVESKSTDV